MARHDFMCQVCGQVLFDVNIPISIGATAGSPMHCGRLTIWMPAVGRMDASSGPTFKSFETFDGRNQPVTIDSLRKLRAVERESEQHAKDGEGQPLRFRHWSNDRSNHDTNTFGTMPFEKPDPKYVEKFGKAIRTATEPDHSYGPGVSDANTSALENK